MDYEFTIEEYNRPAAKFSIGHVAIGLRLSDKLCSNQRIFSGTVTTFWYPLAKSFCCDFSEKLTGYKNIPIIPLI
jgi:hypothetical protein